MAADLNVWRQVRRVQRLPTSPGAAMEFLRLARLDDMPIGQLVRAIGADPVIAMRVLRYANSAMLAVARQAVGLREAVFRLGMRSTRLTMLSFTLATPQDQARCPRFDHDLFWNHSLARALAARELAAPLGTAAAELACVAGLLGGVGKLLLAATVPERYDEILQQAGGILAETASLETRHFGTNAQLVAAELMCEWGLPPTLISLVRYQSNPAHPNLGPEERPLARIVNAAADLAATLVAREPQGSQTRPSGAQIVAVNDRQWQALRTAWLEQSAILEQGRKPDVDPAALQAEAARMLGEVSIARRLKTREPAPKPPPSACAPADQNKLTGLPGAVALGRRLTEILNPAGRRPHMIGLALARIDRLDDIARTHGREVADAVLRGVGLTLAENLRADDFLAHYGADGFAIVFQNLDRLTAAHFCVKLRRAVEVAEIAVEDRSYRAAVSLGTVLAPCADGGIHAGQLIQAARYQLNLSIDKGGNCCSMKQLEIAGSPAGA